MITWGSQNSDWYWNEDIESNKKLGRYLLSFRAQLYCLVFHSNFNLISKQKARDAHCIEEAHIQLSCICVFNWVVFIQNDHVADNLVLGLSFELHCKWSWAIFFEVIVYCLPKVTHSNVKLPLIDRNQFT